MNHVLLAAVDRVGEANGWVKDTVRSFFAGLQNKEITIKLTE